MVEAYKKMFANYANFKDRTTRRDYWLCVLMNFIVGAVFGFVCGFLDGLLDLNVFMYISYAYVLIALIPGIACVIRRLHDVNKSGWFWFIALVPIVGVFILLVYECKPSVTENNNYGKQL